MQSEKEKAEEIRKKRRLAAKGLEERKDGKPIDPLEDVGTLGIDTDPERARDAGGKGGGPRQARLRRRPRHEAAIVAPRARRLQSVTARLMMLWDSLRNSLWALPIALVVVAAGLAVATVQLRLPAEGAVWWLYSGDTSQASGLLRSLLGAMITMATLAISITMVVLALAAQSLGPRLIPIFMGDARTKITLGILIGTVAYLLIVLRTVAGTEQTVPQLAVTLGTVLVLSSMVLLLFFVHHLARSIVADTIIGRVGATLNSYAASLLPERGDDSPPADLNLADLTAGASASVTTEIGGYIQVVDHAGIVGAAREKDALVMLAHRPGQFALAGDTIARVKPPTALDDELASAIRRSVVQGHTRTAVQDLEYSIRQLVEIALRALSPGVNDPHTALAAIDRLTASFSAILRRGTPEPVFRDEDDTIRLVQPATDFAGFLDAAFNEIRQAGASQPAILIRLADRLGQLLAHAESPAADALRRHLQLVQASGSAAIANADDRKDLEARVATAFHHVDGQNRATKS